MDISKEIKELRTAMPKALVTLHLGDKNIRYECDLRHAKISPEEHDSYFEPIKKIFGDRLIERDSHETGYFDIYVKPQTNIRLN